MRNVIRFFAVVGLVSLASAAHAREIDDTWASPLPVRNAARSQRLERGAKRDASIPAKYDVAYPVRDHGPTQRERGSI